jgi:histidinol phosphatase-like PHP family hydrolase
MRASRTVSIALLLVAIVTGTIADRPLAHPALTLGGYRVLAADFHTHSASWSDGSLTPWGLVLEADHQGLDAIAITGHDQTIDSHIGHAFARFVGQPIVLMGDEVLGDHDFHIIAAGIHDTVRYRRSGKTTIERIHEQGGIAIVAHPFKDFWPGYDPVIMRGLDGAEICHPAVYVDASWQQELESFAARAPVAAIGSSDFHGLGSMGLCRTFVFANEASEQGVIDAVRAHRTVVFAPGGHVYGDPQLTQYASQLRPRLPASDSHGSTLDWISRVTAIAGFVGLVLM